MYLPVNCQSSSTEVGLQTSWSRGAHLTISFCHSSEIPKKGTSFAPNFRTLHDRRRIGGDCCSLCQPHQSLRIQTHSSSLYNSSVRPRLQLEARMCRGCSVESRTRVLSGNRTLKGASSRLPLYFHDCLVLFHLRSPSPKERLSCFEVVDETHRRSYLAKSGGLAGAKTNWTRTFCAII